VFLFKEKSKKDILLVKIQNLQDKYPIIDFQKDKKLNIHNRLYFRLIFEIFLCTSSDVYKSFSGVKGKIECFEKKDGSYVCRSRKTKDPKIRILSNIFADYFCGDKI